MSRNLFTVISGRVYVEPLKPSIMGSKTAAARLAKYGGAKRQFRKVGVAGGFFNQLMGNNATEPKVGEGATTLSYSDRHAYDVTWVSEDGLECKIRPCKCTFVGSGYGDERYTYEPDPEAGETLIRWNPKRSKWQIVSKRRQIVKARMKELQAKYGDWTWKDGLKPEFGVEFDDIVYHEGDAEYCEWSAWNQYKLIPGLTKDYEVLTDISIIFGTREQYRDPHF